MPVTEEVKVEATTEEVNPEVVQGPDSATLDPESVLYAIQGKPRCIQPYLDFIKLYRLSFKYCIRLIGVEWQPT